MNKWTSDQYAKHEEDARRRRESERERSFNDRVYRPQRVADVDENGIHSKREEPFDLLDVSSDLYREINGMMMFISANRMDLTPKQVTALQDVTERLSKVRTRLINHCKRTGYNGF